MRMTNAWLTGAGIGAGAALLLDPARGRRRRALLRDKADHLTHAGRDSAAKAVRDLKNRSIGTVHEGRRRLRDRDLSMPEVSTDRPQRDRVDILQRNWAPATRMLVGGLGLALCGAGLARRGALGTLMGVKGLAMLTRSTVNRPFREIFGAGPEEPIVVQKTLHVDAPLDQVWSLWEHPENFPRFMDHLESVERLGDDTYHWVARGPAGSDVEWRARVVERRPQELLRWESLPGSEIDTHGSVRFENGTHGGSRIHVRMSYNPPAGGLGHLVARLFHDDPRSAMNDDMVRLKSLLENGRATAHHRTVEREEVLGRH